MTDAELKALSKQMHIDDVNAVKGVVLNMQSTTSNGNTADKAPLPYDQFFLSVTIPE